jgi:hypothetical protein
VAPWAYISFIMEELVDLCFFVPQWDCSFFSIVFVFPLGSSFAFYFLSFDFEVHIN